MAYELADVKLVHHEATSKGKLYAKDLWSDGKMVVVYVMRRLGCPLCRQLVAELLSYREQFESVNARLAIIIGVDPSADMFRHDTALKNLLGAPNAPIYIDESLAFKKYLGGEVVKNTAACHPSVLCRYIAATLRGHSGSMTADLSCDASKAYGGTIILQGPSVLYMHKESKRFVNCSAEHLFSVCKLELNRKKFFANGLK